MRIAFIVSGFPLLSETFILNQITGMIDRGHDVDIYATVPVDRSKMQPDVENYHLLDRTYYQPSFPSIRIFRLVKGIGLLLANSRKEPRCLLYLPKILKYRRHLRPLGLLYAAIPLLGKRQYDIIHCHFGPNGLKGSLLRDIGAIQGKLITTFHGYDMSNYPKEMGDHVYKRLFDKGDFLLPISEYWRQRMIELGCDDKKIIVHRMGIDCKRLSFIPRRLHANGPVKIVTIARLVEKKGVEFGISAVAKLAKVTRNIQYNIVGDGALKEDLEQLIQDLHLGDRVKLLGWKQQEEIAEILNSSHILLAPSVTSKDGDQEGIPVALMEGMAVGLPIVSTQHSGIPELIQNGVSGFLVAERDVDAFAGRLCYLIEHPEIWPEMGRAGRKFVEDHHDIDKLNDRLVEIYKRLLNGELT